MAPAIPAIAAIIGAGAAIYSGMEQREAAKEAEKVAELNAQYERAETAEQARRLQKEQERTEGLAKAMAAASGVSGGSQDAYLEEMERTHAGELAWMKKAGASRAYITEKQGSSVARAASAQAMGTIGSGVASAGRAGGNLYQTGVQQNWWGQ